MCSDVDADSRRGAVVDDVVVDVDVMAGPYGDATPLVTGPLDGTVRHGVLPGDALVGSDDLQPGDLDVAHGIISAPAEDGCGTVELQDRPVELGEGQDLEIADPAEADHLVPVVLRLTVVVVPVDDEQLHPHHREEAAEDALFQPGAKHDRVVLAVGHRDAALRHPIERRRRLGVRLLVAVVAALRVALGLGSLYR